MLARSFKQPSVMSHEFSRVPHVDIPRSRFKRSHGYKSAFDAGYLVPVYVDEALPGDTFKLKMSAIARMNTPLYPTMDNLYLDTFFFAVPNRILWSNWKKFMGEQDNPGDSTDYTVPEITCPVGGWTANSLADYFGLPTGVDNADVNALHFRAYNMCYNEFFRDQNLQDSVVVDTDDGPDTDTDYVLLRRGKRHDYFTSCLPWPQKDNADAIQLPIGSEAPVIGNTKAIGFWDGTNTTGLVNDQTYGLYAYTTSYNENRGTVDSTRTGHSTNYVRTGLTTTGAASGMIADLSTATASTILEIREAFQLQRMLERDARSGSRYVEIINSHFGVISPDARMQRPEYLGGSSYPVKIDAIPNTDVTNPLGHLGGIGYASINGTGFNKSFTEHCVIIGLVNVRADLTYQYGIDRMWSRQTRYDYYWPSLNSIGEQEVLNKEIYFNNDANDDLVFGYQERYAEYKFSNSKITGQLRSNHAQSLDAWHMSEEFSSLPVLNASFITDEPPIDRIVAVSANQPHFKFDSYFDLDCIRPMPMYSVPGMVDHF